MPRSHDEHFFAHPPGMIDGLIRAPRLDLRNETIFSRHIHAVLLAEFVSDWRDQTQETISEIGQLLRLKSADQTAPLDDFLDDLPASLERNRRAVEVLTPPGSTADATALAANIREAFQTASAYFADEVKMYEEAVNDVQKRQQEAQTAKKYDQANKLNYFLAFLQGRLNDLQKADWVTFFSDRSVLPSYAFPIYNVTLATGDTELKLERDLRIALSEYVPGAAIVAKGRLWESIGVRRPWQKSLERKSYSCCPQCWHVMRHLDRSQVFPDGVCPVCKHDGQHPPRRIHDYIVPSHGFTTDLTIKGKDLSFDRPQRIPASRVLFVPQQHADDPLRTALGTGSLRVEGVARRNTPNSSYLTTATTLPAWGSAFVNSATAKWNWTASASRRRMPRLSVNPAPAPCMTLSI